MIGQRLRLILIYGCMVFSGCIYQTRAQTRKAQPLAQVNSLADELMPVLAPDNKTLYFVRSGHNANIGGASAGQDIWFSSRQSLAAPWTAPRNIGSPLNNRHNNAVGSVAAAGQELWLNNRYLSRQKMAPGLSFTFRTKTGWSWPQPVLISQFKPQTGTLGFFLAPGDSILFLSMQPDSAHLEDLFVSRKVAGQWSQPIPVGPAINSAGFEIAPFLARDNKTLYFATNGHGGFGQADIFRSKRLDESWLHWSQPENLGNQINSAGFDAYLVLDTAETTAYFTSEDGIRKDTDIYSIAMADILPAWKSQQPPVEAPFAKTVEVYFEVGSSQLSDAAEKALQGLGLWLLPQKHWVLTVSGHADDTGQEANNERLSHSRAQAVVQFLIQQGIRKEQIQLQAYGSRQPLSQEKSAAGRAQNRRVDLTVAK